MHIYFVRNICFNDEAIFHVNEVSHNHKHNHFIFALPSAAVAISHLLGHDMGTTWQNFLNPLFNCDKRRLQGPSQVSRPISLNKKATEVYGYKKTEHLPIIPSTCADRYLGENTAGRWEGCEAKSLGPLDHRRIHHRLLVMGWRVKVRLILVQISTIRKALDSCWRRCRLCEKNDCGHFEQLLWW